MSYLPSIVVAAVGLAILPFVALRTVSALRRFLRVRALVTAQWGDEAELLRARSAAVRLGVGERFTRRAIEGGRVPGNMANDQS